MTISSKKKGLFGKFVDLLSGKPTEDSETEYKKDENQFAPRENEPTDLAFVRNFTASGGKFLYCEDQAEAYQYMRMIMDESGLNKVFCHDENLISILQKSSISVKNVSISEADAFCAGCEYLVSFNGGIMITARQTLGRKLDELPETIITIARTSQITENLSSALAGIRSKYKGDIPSQITTIKGPVKLDEIQDSNPGKVCNKEIYLLLLEDQL